MSLMRSPSKIDLDIFNDLYRDRPERKADPSVLANIRIEKIENGYLIIYSKQGVTEERRFARDMKEVGDAVITACTKLELTPGK